MEQRNLTSHVYSQEEVRGILKRLDEYLAAFEELSVRLGEKAK